MDSPLSYSEENECDEYFDHRSRSRSRSASVDSDEERILNKLERESAAVEVLLCYFSLFFSRGFHVLRLRFLFDEPGLFRLWRHYSRSRILESSETKRDTDRGPGEVSATRPRTVIRRAASSITVLCASQYGSAIRPRTATRRAAARTTALCAIQEGSATRPRTATTRAAARNTARCACQSLVFCQRQLLGV